MIHTQPSSHADDSEWGAKDSPPEKAVEKVTLKDRG
jgi:hypothetical protein